MTNGIRRIALALLAGALAAGTLRAEDAAADKKAHDQEVQAALDAFKKAYKGGDEDRAGAVKSLAAAKDRKIIETLSRVLADPSPVVRIEAAGVLAGYEKSRDAAQAIAKALAAAKKQPEVQVACLDALGKIRDWNAAPIVTEHFNDPGATVALAAMRAAGSIKNPAFVEKLIKFLEDAAGGSAARAGSIEEWGIRRAEMRAAAQKALQDITGESRETQDNPAADIFGGRKAAKEWEDWWKIYGPRTTARLQKEEQAEQDKIAKEKRGY